MPITSVTKDPTALTMTVTAQFAAPVQRVWDAYADPRQIEKFWGPVEWPATFIRHDMAPGGFSHFYMTSPEGERSAGYWEFLKVDAPHFFEVLDGFATADGVPNTQMPSMRMTYEFEEAAGGTKVTTVTYFNSADELHELLEMGMEEGLTSAMSQIDDVVTDLESFAASRATETQILSDTQVRVSRIIGGSPEQVWRAHHDADLVQQWLLGPEGWTMPVCDIAKEVGDTYRYEWENVQSGERFGFTGELLESQEPYRSVTTEKMIGMEGEGTVNEMTLTPQTEGTLLSIVITYPSAEMRDVVLSTGMADGMETSYARMEREVLSTM